jgi:hypothetical protein
MKSKLSAGVCRRRVCVGRIQQLLSRSPLILSGTFISSVPGAVLFEDFDSIQNTPRRHHHRWLCSRSRDNGLGSPRTIGNFIVADGALGTSLNVTVTLSDPVSYVGLAWGTPDPMNEDAPPWFYLLGSFFGDFAIGSHLF